MTKPTTQAGGRESRFEQTDVDPWDGSFVGERTEIRERDGLGKRLVGRESRGFIIVAEGHDFQQRARPEKIKKVISQSDRPIRSGKIRPFEVKIREMREVEPETIEVHGDQGQDRREGSHRFFTFRFSVPGDVQGPQHWDWLIQ